MAGAISIAWPGPGPEDVVAAGVATVGVGVLAYEYGPPLLEKMNAEIGRLMEKAAGPKGAQYSLRATTGGAYPCYKCESRRNRDGFIFCCDCSR
jgi:hypothetical protein